MRNLGTTLTQHTYSASFGHIAMTASNNKVAILMNVMDEQGHPLTDHVWIKNNECEFILDKVAFRRGERVFFTAEPYRYIKGSRGLKAYKQLEIDIGLRNIVFRGHEC
jgi:hypothetical protein